MFKSEEEEGEEEFNSEWIDLSVSECIERREMKKKIKSNEPKGGNNNCDGIEPHRADPPNPIMC